MKKIPDSVNAPPLPGLKRIHQGKVRDTYELPDHPNLRLVVATNRISIFDFVLGCQVQQKGQVLTAMNILWRTQVFKPFPFNHDLVAFGKGIEKYLPVWLHNMNELPLIGIIVQNYSMIDVEEVVRGYLTGTGWEAYGETGFVCGHALPHGLHDGCKLPRPIFTPTTKAKVGHDEHMSRIGVVEKYGIAVEQLPLSLYELAQTYALRSDTIIADTKFEIGYNSEKKLGFGDEILTPDSSRFWDYEEWLRAQTEKKSPPPHDKQFVRNEGKKLGIHKRNPKNAEDVLWVGQQVFPNDVLEQTTGTYKGIFRRLAGMSLEEFQFNFMLNQ